MEVQEERMEVQEEIVKFELAIYIFPSLFDGRQNKY